MGYWEDQYLGIAAKDAKPEVLRQILDCIGANINDSDPYRRCDPSYREPIFKLDEMVWGNVTEIRGNIFWDDLGYGDLDDFEDLLAVLADMFPKVQMGYVSDCGHSVSDSQSFGVHLRTIYTNEKNTVMCREDDASLEYSDNGAMVPDVDHIDGLISCHVALPWEKLQPEIEKAAQEKGIEVAWREYIDSDMPADFKGIEPDYNNEEFSNLCDEIFEEKYDYCDYAWLFPPYLEYEYKTRAVDDETKQTKYNQLLSAAIEKGYKELISLLDSSKTDDTNTTNEESSSIGDSQNIDSIDRQYYEPTSNDIDLKNYLKRGIELVGTQYEGRNDRIERVKVGDSVQLVRDINNIFDKDAIEVFNEEGSLGHISARAEYIGNYSEGLRPALKDLSLLIDNNRIEYDASVLSVTPLSQRSARCKNALITIAINIKFIDCLVK